MKDVLFLLKPGFLDGKQRFFCPSCATVEGVLSFYPHLRELVDVRYIGYERPRPGIVEMLGPDHQGAPCLVVTDPARVAKAPMGLGFQHARDLAYLNEPLEIFSYLAAVHGVDAAHT